MQGNGTSDVEYRTSPEQSAGPDAENHRVHRRCQRLRGRAVCDILCEEEVWDEEKYGLPWLD